MPKYKVELEQVRTVYLDAPNEYMAAIAAVNGDGAETTVRSVDKAYGRTPGAVVRNRKPSQPLAKKRKPLTPEARAKLSQNLVKARAARAAKAKAAKKR